MPHALILSHIAFEDVGTLGPVLKTAGFTHTQLDAKTADWANMDPQGPDLVVVLGGPMGVYEQERYPYLAQEMRYLRLRLLAQRPVLGICLGAQLLAAARGAAVYPGQHGKEIGWSALKPVAGVEPPTWLLPLLAPGVEVLHWHGDTFDLPEGSRYLAASIQYPHQIFAWGDYALGLQCHPEVTAEGLEAWYQGHADELAAAGVEVTALRQASQRQAPILREAAKAFWLGWLQAVAARPETDWI